MKTDSQTYGTSLNKVGKGIEVTQGTAGNVQTLAKARNSRLKGLQRGFSQKDPLQCKANLLKNQGTERLLITDTGWQPPGTRTAHIKNGRPSFSASNIASWKPAEDNSFLRPATYRRYQDVVPCFWLWSGTAPDVGI